VPKPGRLPKGVEGGLVRVSGRWLGAVLAVLAVAASTGPAASAAAPARAAAVQAAPRAAAAGGGYLTVLFGRSQWQGAVSCTLLPNPVTLDDAVGYAAARGVRSTGGVVLAYTRDTTRRCTGKQIYPTWSDLAALRSKYGFQAISQSRSYNTWNKLTTAQEFYDESCGTLPELRSHGFDRAWGLFSYPNNRQPAVALPVVTSCFAFGRSYGHRLNTKAPSLRSPYLVRTLSVSGGRCANPALPCSTLAQPAYLPPESYADLLAPPAGTYALVQFYRFVVGVGKIGRLSWDCTGASSADHWTTDGEVYCWNDYQKAITLVSRTATTTDPATVAEAWGRVPATFPVLGRPASLADDWT
jgi:hypothetical protein